MKQSIILKPLGQNKPSSTSNLLKKTMQVTAFTFSCLVALPSFVQTADAQSYWDGEVIAYGSYNPWGGWDGWGDEGQGCYMLGCESYGSGNGGSNGGGSNAAAHEEYCTDVANVVSLFSGVKIIGTAGAILSLGGMAGNFAVSSLEGGIRDIKTFYQSGGTTHAGSPYFGIDWNAANINWQPFIDQWTAMGNGGPSTTNGGFEHVLALYFQSVGVGSGPSNVTPPSDLLPEDPDPGLSCN